jgi:hypothetical protein
VVVVVVTMIRTLRTGVAAKLFVATDLIRIE